MIMPEWREAGAWALEYEHGVALKTARGRNGRAEWKSVSSIEKLRLQLAVTGRTLTLRSERPGLRIWAVSRA